jgi:hypothetical protein
MPTHGQTDRRTDTTDTTNVTHCVRCTREPRQTAPYPGVTRNHEICRNLRTRVAVWLLRCDSRDRRRT